MRLTSVLVVAIALLLPLTPGLAQNCFPEQHHTYKSPSERYLLEWKEPTDDNDVHRLLLQPGTRVTELLAFPRYVCSFWSPDEAFLAVTDHSGSNTAETYLFETARPSNSWNIEPALPASIRHQLEHSSHGYVETIAWDGAGLMLRVWGDSISEDGDAFDERLLCKTTDSSADCTRVASASNPEQAAR